MFVDDYLPVDSQGRLLFPTSSLSGELWPLLLSKAICKVIWSSYESCGDVSEMGDACILHVLTGWLPESYSLSSRLVILL